MENEIREKVICVHLTEKYQNISFEVVSLGTQSYATVDPVEILKIFAGLKCFQSVAGNRFKIGVLLYDGDHTTAFGDNLHAVPLGALWS